ncbi:type II toxin-antitoxin system Phd/YefM family antitoxin [Brevundimonas sp.]|jgi:prevent-host-death family protein|uniref:type II toxin-antitoxin system Phd/YefM family antitoxin n=1 Tax=Brevundimonas sp. TaxID=1871086 RepID=UPI0037C10544
MDRVSVRDAASHLAELVSRAESGEDVEIVVDGRVAARLTSAPRRLIPPSDPHPFDWDSVAATSSKMARQTESAGDFFRRLRDEAKY